MSYGPPCPGCGNDMDWKLGKDGEECLCGWPGKSFVSHPANTPALHTHIDYSKPIRNLPYKVIQMCVMNVAAYASAGEYNKLVVLCEDGNIWEQYHSHGCSHVPTDMLWHPIPT